MTLLYFCVQLIIPIRSEKTLSRLYLLARTFIFCFLLTCFGTSSAQTISHYDSLRLAAKHMDIRTQQDRIDLFDQTADQTVTLKSDEFTKRATDLYFQAVDDIILIIDSSKLSVNNKLRFLGQLENTLKEVNDKDYIRFPDIKGRLEFISGFIEATKKSSVEDFLDQNIYAAIQFINLYKDEACAETILLRAAATYPEEIFNVGNQLAYVSFGNKIIEHAAIVAPMIVKKYLPTPNFISSSLTTSNDSVVQVIMAIYHKYGMPSKAFALLDDIMSKKLTIDSANKISLNPRIYFDRMIDIRVKENPLGAYSLDQELEYSSLDYVRVINDLHNMQDNTRFASINDFNARELYTLIVYSQQEIFTTTFLGFFNRMMNKMKTNDGEEFLSSMGNNRYRKFITMCVGYNTLDQFFAILKDDAKEKLLTGFVSNLEKNNGDLTQAVDVADTFGSIQDSTLFAFFQAVIKKEYNRVQGESNDQGMVLYGLLAGMFAGRSNTDQDWTAHMSSEYQLKPLDKIANADMFDAKDTCFAYIVFYDDKDGAASFASFLSQYQDGNWKIDRMDHYVRISSAKGKHVAIYANYPKNEYDGQPELVDLFNQKGSWPEIVMHRGHSYYVTKTIDQVTSNAKIVLLGSCGGYHILSKVIDQSPDVHVISSKQIGTMMVNDPLLHEILETIRKGDDVNWLTIWNNLDKRFKGNKDLYDKFSDYIPPHKNLGVIFIQAYNRMMQNSFSLQ